MKTNKTKSKMRKNSLASKVSVGTNSRNLIYPELSYQIMGVCFKVHNKLGSKYQEKYYQRAIEVELKKQKIPFKREMMVRLSYEGENIGRYFIDFLIDKRIVLETKTIDFFRKKEYSHDRTLLAYSQTFAIDSHKLA